QNEYLISMRKLFKNLVIAISIVYLSYLVNFDITLPFAPLVPPKLSLSLLILPLIIWPIYKFINELKFLARKVTNKLLRQAFPTKDRNIQLIEREVGEIFSGLILVLIGVGSTAYVYFHFPSEFLFLLIPAAYTLISIMYLSRSFYGLIEEYEALEEDIGESALSVANKAVSALTKEFNEHAKLLRGLQMERLEAKDKIQDAIRTNNLLAAKQVLANFKRQENRALINIFDVNTLKKYPKLRGMLEGDIRKSRNLGGEINGIGTKEAFVKYMQEHLKPQLYEMELERMKGGGTKPALVNKKRRK
ncbi:MAG: hypothetical protein V1658_01435, partial [Candidatus Micrarchaeota archaeon]